MSGISVGGGEGAVGRSCSALTGSDPTRFVTSDWSYYVGPKGTSLPSPRMWELLPGGPMKSSGAESSSAAMLQREFEACSASPPCMDADLEELRGVTRDADTGEIVAGEPYTPSDEPGSGDGEILGDGSDSEEPPSDDPTDIPGEPDPEPTPDDVPDEPEPDPDPPSDDDGGEPWEEAEETPEDPEPEE